MMSASLRLFNIDFKIVPYGERAIILRPREPLDDPLPLPRIGEQLVDAAPHRIDDVIATHTELMIVGPPKHVSAELADLAAAPIAQDPVSDRTFRLPVLFEEATEEDEAKAAPDWDHVLDVTGLSKMNRGRVMISETRRHIPSFE